jgi:alpha-ribazole phosphatase
MGHRIHLLRHAPLLNVAGIAYGREAEINRTPRQSFRTLAQNLPAGAVWMTSDYPRTLATAEELLKEGAPPPALWPPLVCPAFTEQSWGNWIGRRHSEIAASDPSYTTIFRQQPGWADTAPPLGESFNQLVARVGQGLEALVQEDPSGEVVIVSHGGTLRAALVHVGWGDANQVIKTPARYLSQLILTHDRQRIAQWAVEKLP